MEKNVFPSPLQFAYIYTGKINKARTHGQTVDLDYPQCYIPRAGPRRV